MPVIRRIGPLSVAKMSATIYALMGFIFGIMFFFASFVMPNQGSGLPAMLFGAGAIIVLPIFYGVLGFVVSLIAAAMYNVFAGVVGGIQVDLE